ncbi:MAG: transporter substrate-binding domain-containing protein [Pseudomonadota bacterium]
MLTRLSAALAGILAISAGLATSAAACGGTYTVARGDSLTQIANDLYKDARKWSVIYQTNVARIGDDPERITVGTRLTLTCIDGLPAGLEDGLSLDKIEAVSALSAVPFATPETRERINLLTADDYRPFTDRTLPGGGMFTEIVTRAMEAAAPDDGFAIHWVNDWASHHDPLLSQALLDLGFPWFKPDCAANPRAARCETLVFSEPVFEVLTLLFVRTGDPLTFSSDSDLHGASLCRPAGYSTFIFDEKGRNWLADGHVSLDMPETIEACFEGLVADAYDGVVLNEFTGREKINALGLAGQVEVAAGRPIAIDGLHIVAHKAHPEADELIALVNAGLAEIKRDGTYQRTIDTHMTRIWAELAGS